MIRVVAKRSTIRKAPPGRADDGTHPAGEEREPPRGVLITCEHASNHVPKAYRARFRDADAVLRSHRGWDPGALELGRDLARAFHVPVLAGHATRLLVDLNRTARSATLFSEFTRDLGEVERVRILKDHYDPHWIAAARAIEKTETVLHIGAHSFTPIFAGRRRRCDVGLLYDPRRPGEAALARRWQRALKARRPDLTVLRNQPYRGWTDGMTTWFRGRYDAHRYWGLEVEVNQRWVPAANPARVTRSTPRVIAEWDRLRSDIVHALRTACTEPVGR